MKPIFVSLSAAVNQDYIDKVIELRKQGLSLTKIGYELGKSANAILRVVKKFDPDYSENTEKRKENAKDYIKKAIELRKQGLSNAEIGKQLGKDPTSIGNLLRRNDPNYSKSLQDEKLFREEEIKDIIKLKSQGLSIKDIAKKFNRHSTNISAVLIKYDLEYTKSKNEYIKKAIELRNQGLTLKEIGKQLGKDSVTIYSLLKRHDSEHGKAKQDYIQKVIELRNQGLVHEEIGKIVGKGGNTIHSLLKKYKPEYKTIKEQVQEAIKLRKQSLTYEDIGKKLGKTGSSIRKLLNRHAPELAGRISKKVELNKNHYAINLHDKDRKRILDDYNNKGLEIAEIAERTGLDEKVVTLVIRQEQ